MWDSIGDGTKKYNDILQVQLDYYYPAQAKLPSDNHVSYKLKHSQIQVGGNDCGLFAAANAMMLAMGLDPLRILLDQSQMRRHFMMCLEN